MARKTGKDGTAVLGLAGAFDVTNWGLELTSEEASGPAAGDASTDRTHLRGDWRATIEGVLGGNTPRLTGKNGAVSLGGSPVADITGWEFTASSVTAKHPAAGDAGPSRTALRLDWEAVVNALYQGATTHDLLGTEAALVLKLVSSHSSGLVSDTGLVTAVNYGAPLEDAITLDYTIKSFDGSAGPTYNDQPGGAEGTAYVTNLALANTEAAIVLTDGTVTVLDEVGIVEQIRIRCPIDGPVTVEATVIGSDGTMPADPT